MILSGSVNPDGNVDKINAGIDRVQNEFAWHGGSCVDLDFLIKKVRDRLVLERGRLGDEYYIRALIYQKSMLEGQFVLNSCADKIETLRQNESAVLITKQAIEQEKAVLKPANTEQRIYTITGAVILMVGLIILVKK